MSEGHAITFRFLHTADLHLDSPLKSLALKDAELAGLIGNASRKVFESIVGICLDERLDALLIAGDLFDGTLRSVKTAAYLSKQLRLLDEAGVAVYMIRGNHDAEASAITKQLDLPSSVHVFTGTGGAVKLEDKGVAIHGVSFANKTMPNSLLPKFKQPVAGMANIGLMHTSIGGSERHDVYAPVSVTDLVAHGFDYWALGHIHKRQVHHENPFIVMPGIPQGRDMGEAGPKSVTLGTIDEAGIRIEERLTSIAEFVDATVDVTAAQNMEDVSDLIAQTIRDQAETTQSELTVLRLTLTGETPLAWSIQRDRDTRLEEARIEASALGTVWIESLRAQPSQPSTSTTEDDPVIELRNLMESTVIHDETFRKDAEAALAALVSKLPSELRNDFGKDEAERERILDALIKDGSTDVTAALHGMTERSDG